MSETSTDRGPGQGSVASSPMSSTFGRWLVELGALPDEAALADVLARQSERMPVASVAYVLGAGVFTQ